MRCLDASEFYAKQLLHPDRGYPLWYPEDSVHPGDVGRITDDEGFFRFFNAFQSKEHETNRVNVTIPGDFQQFACDEKFIVKRDNVIPAGWIGSEGVKFIENDPEQGHYTFEWPEDQDGAFLLLKESATSEEVERHKALDNYIKNNCSSWLALNDDEEIFFILGVIKTADWYAAESHHDSSSRSRFFNLQKWISIESSVQSWCTPSHRAGPMKCDTGKKSNTMRKWFTEDSEKPLQDPLQQISHQFQSSHAHLTLTSPSSTMAESDVVEHDQCIFVRYVQITPGILTGSKWPKITWPERTSPEVK